MKAAAVEETAQESEPFGSFDPDQLPAGGFLDDRNVQIVSAEIVSFDYGGKSKYGPALCAKIGLREIDADGETVGDDDEAVIIQHYRIGSADKFVASANGKFYRGLGGSSMTKKTELALFLRSFKENGGEMTGFRTDGIAALVGWCGHLNAFPQEKYTDRETGEEKKRRDILLFTKVWEAAAPGKPKAKPTAKAAAPPPAKAKASTAAAAQPAPAAESAGDSESEANSPLQAAAEELVVSILADADGGAIAKKSLASAIFKAEADPKRRNALIGLVATPWFSDAARPWTVDGATVSIGG